VQSCLGVTAAGAAGFHSLAHSLRGPSPEPVPVARYVLTMYTTILEGKWWAGWLWESNLDAKRQLCDEGKPRDFANLRQRKDKMFPWGEPSGWRREGVTALKLLSNDYIIATINFSESTSVQFLPRLEWPPASLLPPIGRIHTTGLNWPKSIILVGLNIQAFRISFTPANFLTFSIVIENPTFSAVDVSNAT